MDRLLEELRDSGLFGKVLRFNGTNGFVSTTATGEDLGIDGKKSRTISFWAFVEDGNPRSNQFLWLRGKKLSRVRIATGQ